MYSTVQYYPTNNSRKLIDIVCLFVIGLGVGSIGMYFYAVKNPQEIIQAQPHVLIQPQDNTAGKLKQALPNLVQEI